MDNLSPGKKDAILNFSGLDFDDEGYLSPKGQLQVCAYVLNFLQKGGEYEQRLQKAGEEDKGLKPLVSIIQKIENFRKEKEYPNIKDGLAIMKLYYKVHGRELDDSFNLIPLPSAPSLSIINSSSSNSNSSSSSSSSSIFDSKAENEFEPGRPEYHLAYITGNKLIGAFRTDNEDFIPLSKLRGFYQEKSSYFSSDEQLVLNAMYQKSALVTLSFTNDRPDTRASNQEKQGVDL